jgi:hypothetical protein
MVGFRVPLPVAHGLVGAGVVAALLPSAQPGRWKWLAFGALLGIAPDFDYALNWLHIGRGGWHHGRHFEVIQSRFNVAFFAG